jgi:hypothetical protein
VNVLSASELVRDKKVVAAIDFHRTSIYATDASHGQWPEHVVAADPHAHFHNVSEGHWGDRASEARFPEGNTTITHRVSMERAAPIVARMRLP